MAYRIQGVLLKEKPSEAALMELTRRYSYKLFELVGRPMWLLDLDLPAAKPGDRAAIRAARPLAPSYVDTLRVLGSDEQAFEQAPWLTATAGLAKLLGKPVLGFVSDDEGLDFATVATPDGVSVIGDHLEPYLMRWEAGALMIQPYSKTNSSAETPGTPDELSLIPSATVLATEPLSGGYPLHGNVLAELEGFAPGVDMLGIGTWNVGPVGTLKLLASEQMEHSVWDRAAAGQREPAKPA